MSCMCTGACRRPPYKCGGDEIMTIGTEAKLADLERRFEVLREAVERLLNIVEMFSENGSTVQTYSRPKPPDPLPSGP